MSMTENKKSKIVAGIIWTVCHLKFSEHTQPMLNACEAQNENNSSAD